MAKWLILGLVVYAVAFGAAVHSVKTEQPVATSVATQKPLPMGIVRLHEMGSGRFTCSGFVVGKTTLITAAHCIPPELLLEVRAADGKRTGIVAMAVGGNARADLAIMRGRFKRFAPLQYSYDPKVVLNNIESNSKKLLACGFPYGGKLLCTPVTNRHMYAFHIAANGYLYPGMSGGPVIDEATNTVIALNSAVTENVILIAPLIEIYSACDVKPEP